MPSGVKAGGTGCRDYAATYFSIPHHLKVNLPSTSQNECSDAQMETEQGYFLGLNAARDYRILGNELYIYYDSSALIFIGDHLATKVGPLAPLNNTFWRLTSIDSTNALPQTEVTISIEINPDGNTGFIRGLGGCNTYNAEIRDVFKLGAINYTKEICETPEGVMDQENTYLDALQNATGIWYEGPNLVIETSFGDLNFISIRQEIVKPTPTPTLGALTAVIVSPKNAYPEETLKFDGSQSTPASAIQKYQWWFSDDFTAEGVTVDRAFSTPGYYDVILTVFTSNGERAEGSLKVNIQVPLVDTPWLLYDGSATLKFSESTLSGNAGCNDYSASYTALVAPGGPYEISIGSINVTGKTCKDEVMKKEQAFLAELATVTHYSIQATSLTLTTPKGTLNFYSAK
jgi:heat shock protein HslJ